MVEQLKYRFELKHIINAGDAIAIRSRMRAALTPDASARQNGRYVVRSLYFDDLEDTALRDKINGVPSREKFRIRLYSQDTRLIRLEKKIKHGGMSAKLQAPLTLEQAGRLVRADVAWCKDSSHAAIRDFYVKSRTGMLQPRVIVEYDREAYIHRAGNTRVTLDSNVRTAIGHVDILDFGLPTVPALGPGLVILEIKYDRFLPDFILALIQLGDCTTTPVSKYAVCRKYV